MSGNQLVPTPKTQVEGPVVVVIMDGVGIGQGDKGDALAKAHTPNLDQYLKGPLATELKAHGTAVGLSNDADMGNSEVGHNAIGAGRIFDQGSKLVQEAIESGSLFSQETWLQLSGHCVANQKPMHLIGLLSDGNVHSHINHLIAILKRADACNIEKLYIHALLDGRDVPKTSALSYIEQLETILASINTKPKRRYKIASGGGRMTTTMDRYEADWAMVERGWKTHVLGEGRYFSSTREAVELFRKESPGISDQDLPPFVIHDGEGAIGPIEDGDAVILFNFRGDRMLEITQALEDPNFSAFDRIRFPNIHVAGMTLYDGDTQRPKRFLVQPPAITNTLGELLCDVGIRQLACSETQKFGHVTYFWNGNRSGYFDPKLERYLEIPSVNVPFDQRPEMSASQITDAILTQLDVEPFDFGRINFANGDMVGHTGNFAATVQALEVVDAQLSRIVAEITKRRGAVIITADHGNADDMGERDKKTGQLLFSPDGAIIPKTSHSLNPVPLSIALHSEDEAKYQLQSIHNPSIANIAASAATLLGFDVPDFFEPSLIGLKRP